MRLECFWALRKVQHEAIPTVPSEGQADKCKALKPRNKAANVPKWAQRSQESICESGGEVGDGAGKRVMECEMCTEGQGGEELGKAVAVKVAEVHNMARHVLTKDRTGAVALTAALESAMQLEQGDKVNRHAEMANPTKSRDSLQPPCTACDALLYHAASARLSQRVHFLKNNISSIVLDHSFFPGAGPVN
jgi:hypothetical protein